MNTTRFAFCILLVAFVCATGCAGLMHHPDPLARWHQCFSQDPDRFDKAITADYKDYIAKLSVKEREHVGIITFFEDGTGQHAVKIEIGIKGTWWQHILIYDKNSERIKKIKYSSGSYRS